MTRRPDPDRIDHAKREGVRMRLMGQLRLNEESAEQWLQAWEQRAPRLEGDGGYWDDWFGWIEQQIAAGRRTP